MLDSPLEGNAASWRARRDLPLGDDHRRNHLCRIPRSPNVRRASPGLVVAGTLIVAPGFHPVAATAIEHQRAVLGLLWSMRKRRHLGFAHGRSRPGLCLTS